LTPAIRALQAAGVPFQVHAFTAGDRSGSGSASSYGLEAAAALGVPADQVFKTLVTDLDGALWVAVLPVTGQLDLKAFAAAAEGKRAALAEAARAQRSTGYVIGGISPLGQRTPLPAVLDESALTHPTVFVSGGRRGLDVELAPEDLLRLLGGRSRQLTRWA
jgi:Cys-tRNA(Pro)/Cys-tRNA(Cys) deacylase